MQWKSYNKYLISNIFIVNVKEKCIAVHLETLQWKTIAIVIKNNVKKTACINMLNEVDAAYKLDIFLNASFK